MRADSSARAVATPRARPHTGLGVVVAGLALSVAAAALAGRAARKDSYRARGEERQRILSRSRDGAAILSFTVLADSALEHYRGGYHHRPMYAAPTMGALSLAADLAAPQRGRGAGPVRAVHAAAVLTGIAGLYLHARNVARRPGGFCWNNLFYAAPLGAPGALMTSGLIGAVTHVMGTSGRRHEGHANRRHGRQLAAMSAAALGGQAAEVGLLHFRGAYHNPFMYLPVTLPPLAAAGLAAEALRPDPRRRRRLRPLLRCVEALGVIGTAFHVFGVARNMGGWRNWRQNALQGPPTPAPIAFIGLGRTGLAALDLLDLERTSR